MGLIAKRNDKNKIALFNGELQLTDYIYDEVTDDINSTLGKVGEVQLIDKDANGYYVVQKDGKQGLIDTNGILKLDCKYDIIYTPFNDDVVVVEQYGKKGLLNDDLEEITPCQYDFIKLPFENGIAITENNGRQGLISEDGNEILPCVYDSIGNTYERAIDVCLKDERNRTLHGLVSYEGEKITDCKYDNISQYKGNILQVESDEKCGLIRDNGKTIGGMYESINAEGENGYVKVFDTDKNGQSKTGLLDLNEDREVLPCKYSSVSYPDENGVILVEKEKLGYGLRDIDGNIVLDTMYKNIVTPFVDGVALYQMDNLYGNDVWGLLDDKGNILEEAKYDKIEIEDGVVKFYKGETVTEHKLSSYVQADDELTLTL